MSLPAPLPEPDGRRLPLRTAPPEAYPARRDPPPPLAPAAFIATLLALALSGVVLLFLPESRATEEPLVPAPPPPPADATWMASAAQGSGALRLTLDGSPAVVWLDGEPSGVTPFEEAVLAAGPRALRITRDGTVLLDTTLYVASGVALHLHLVERVREVEVSPPPPPSPAPPPFERPVRRAAGPSPPPDEPLRSAPPPTRSRIGW